MSPASAHPLIPRHLLLACEPFGARLSAAAVLAALGRGVNAAGLPQSDLCELPSHDRLDGDPRVLLDRLNFDARMRGARAVLIGAAQLHENTLSGSLAFEIATRARQSGVPAYAVTGQDSLSSFDARILDLQTIVQGRSAAALVKAGERLGRVV